MSRPGAAHTPPALVERCFPRRKCRKYRSLSRLARLSKEASLRREESSTRLDVWFRRPRDTSPLLTAGMDRIRGLSIYPRESRQSGLPARTWHSEAPFPVGRLDGSSVHVPFHQVHFLVHVYDSRASVQIIFRGVEEEHGSTTTARSTERGRIMPMNRFGAGHSRVAGS